MSAFGRTKRSGMQLDEETLELLGYGTQDAPWESVYSRRPGSGENGAVANAKRQVTRKRNLQERRRKNRLRSLQK